MVCSGAYPEAPRWPMLSTGASAGVLLTGAPEAAEATINETPTRTTINHNRRIFRPPISRLGQPYAETVVGRGLERAHPELLGGLGELAGDPGRQVRRRRGGGHLDLSDDAAPGERPPDGEGEPIFLHVDEEGLPVGREGRPGELGLALGVAGEHVGLALRRDPDYA